jgi:ribose/xylose/arabinose/galactoside ABC-type transport system permease subunit
MTTTDTKPTAVDTSTRSRGLSPSTKEHLQVYLPLVAIIVGLSAWANAKNPAFLTEMNIQRMLVASSVLGILAVGQTLLLVGGQMDLSVGSMVSVTSVLAAKLTQDGHAELLAVAACLVFGALVGLVWGVLVSTLRVPPFILTLGGLALFSSVASTLADNTPIPIVGSFEWLQTGEVLGQRVPVVICAACLLVGGVVLHFTRLGRNIFAIGANEEAAFLAGVPVTATKLTIYVVNGVLAGLAGVVFTGRVGAGDPRGGSGLELIVIAAIVLGGASLAGGRGSVVGSALGVLVLGVVGSAMTFLNVPDTYNQFVFGLILIVAVSLTASVDLRRRRRVRRKP